MVRTMQTTKIPIPEPPIKKTVALYELNLPSETNKSDVNVKDVFMVDYGSCVIHLYNNLEKRDFLIYRTSRGETKWHPLRFNSTVKQLTKLSFVVLHHDDCSVDKIEMIKGKWSTAKIR